MEHGLVHSDELMLIAAIVSARQLNAAARQLRIDHSTLYRRLTSLERRLGQPLFERERGRYEPTAAGQALAQAAIEWQRQQATLSASLAAASRAPQSPLRVTTTEDVAMFLLPGCLHALQTRSPGLRVEVLVDDRALDLGHSDADLAIRPTRHPPLGWVGVNQGRIEMGSYSVPRLARAAALPRRPWVMRSPASSPPADLAWMQAHVPPARIVATFSGLSALVAAAEAGVGAVLLPRFVGDRCAALVRDAAEPAGAAFTPRQAARLWLLCHTRLRKDARVAAFLGVARQALRLVQPGQRSGVSVS
jgi:DNA-binding transcriptional LysR family regulator